jgi:hypothetical protein
MRLRLNRRTRTTVVGVGLAVALVTAACTGGGGGGREETPSADLRRLRTIPQPTVDNLTVAPAGKRVDTAMPTFSNPTEVTNALFPIGRQHSVVQLGRVDGKAFRTEVTLLPDTRVMEWEGRRIETLVSQYAAFLDGRIFEVAYDYYAQADDGSVWYFGEDVFNFKNGVIADTHGTWITGRMVPPR